MNSGISRDDWLRALNDIGHSDQDDQGAVTIKEFGAMFGMPETSASYRLRRLELEGKAVRTWKLQRNGYGRNVRYVAYRLT